MSDSEISEISLSDSSDEDSSSANTGAQQEYGIQDIRSDAREWEHLYEQSRLQVIALRRRLGVQKTVYTELQQKHDSVSTSFKQLQQSSSKVEEQYLEASTKLQHLEQVHSATVQHHTQSHTDTANTIATLQAQLQQANEAKNSVQRLLTASNQQVESLQHSLQVSKSSLQKEKQEFVSERKRLEKLNSSLLMKTQQLQRRLLQGNRALASPWSGGRAPRCPGEHGAP